MEKFIVGLVLGAVILAIVLLITTSPNKDKVKGSSSAKQECELTLPRNQQCIFQYVPEETNE